MKKLMTMKLMTMFAMGLTAAAMAASFSYQGVLKDAQGGAVAQKNQSVTFRLYNGPGDGAQALWGRTVAVLLDDDGLFNVELSDNSGDSVEGLSGTLDDVLAANAGGEIYIGLTVAGSAGEIRPRQKVLSVPLANFARDVKTARGEFTVSGHATFNGPVSANGNVEVKGTNVVRTLSVSDGATISGDVNMTGALNLSGGSLQLPATASFTIGGVSAVVPRGVIVMWGGSANDVPAGWALCDGQGGRPDLRDRFIVGAGHEYAVGATGGTNEVKLTVEQIPAHNHPYKFTGADLVASWKNADRFYNQSGEYKNHANTKYTESTGGGEAHENRPPYYALCFIIKL